MPYESPRFESWDERRRCLVIPSWDCLEQQFFIFDCCNGVGIIRMEDLTEIRNRAKSKKEAGRNLHSWAFDQLQKMMKYKAEMVGIRFEFIQPDFTSQTCKSGRREKANRNGIQFRCKKCGDTCMLI